MKLDDPNIASQNPHPAAEDELIQWGDDADMPASSANHHRISSTSSASLQLQRHSSQSVNYERADWLLDCHVMY